MSLREYNRKRNFRVTPEPPGGDTPCTPGRKFVIQKHAASRLHYDVRLELDGTLKSWVVPKGPNLDPDVKSLAVQVEDHPLEYGSFEGVIPKGEYGGGTVIVWDHGTWTPEGDAAKAYKRGKLNFQLHGKKLHGNWTLVRMSGGAEENGKNWLLMKQRDSYARPKAKVDILAREPRSVISHRTIEQIAADADGVCSSNKGETATKSGKSLPRQTARSKKRQCTDPVPNEMRLTGTAMSVSNTPVDKQLAKVAGTLTGATQSAQPMEFEPQLATLSTDVPHGDSWLHELKFDGYRILVFFDGGKVRLVTRNGKDWTDRFPSIAAAFRKLPVRQGILDGEIVALNTKGVSEFQLLQNSMKRGIDSSLVCYVFDVPHFAGWDLTETPLVERKRLLSRLLVPRNPKNDGTLRYSDHFRGQGEQILRKACRGGMEGIVAKLADSGYRQARAPSWRKVKCLKRQEFVIGGFTKPSGSRVGFGALLLGYHDGSELIYCGRVGTGFSHDSLRQLKVELRNRTTDIPPFKNPPKGSQSRGVTWVKPELVGEVAFTEWTDDGLLRHPAFQGLREDKLAKQVVREEPRMLKRISKSTINGNSRDRARASSGDRLTRPQIARDADTTVANVLITHPDRVLYETIMLTKLDVAKFYEQIAAWILPYVVGRPLTLVRCPEGSQGECFYQKHLTGSLPKGVRGVMIQDKQKREEYVVIDDKIGLISLVQMGVLELHPWSAREDDVERPDRLIFDLDPGEAVAWKAVIQGARDIHDLLDELELKCFVRTSGSKGLHVVAPLSRRNTWDELKTFAKSVAEALVRRAPEKYTATISKSKRQGKILIDYLRNQRGATAVASYSTRARAGAPVATPLAWEELSPRIKSDTYRISNLPKRLISLRKDPWEELFKTRQSLTKKMLSS